MLLPHRRLLNVPILSLQTGAPLGYTKQPIIDPRQLNIVAFYCGGQRVEEPAVLHVSDIREFGELGMIVNDADVIMPPSDLVRLQQIIGFHFELLGKPVIDTRKRKLGKIESYSVEAETFYIAKLTVQQSALRNFFGATLLIDRTQIVEVNDRQIIVQSNEIKEKVAQRPANMLLENPFKRRPQTEVTHSEREQN